jgi:DNA repair exonuclease SbcCD ATPase subunit
MAKKPTARQRDISRLAEQYQSQLSALTPEYESIFQQKEAAIKGGEQANKEYTKKLEAFNKQLAAYKKNPFEAQKIRGSFEPYGKTYEWGYVIDNNWYSAKNLPEGYVEESATGDFALKKKPVPTFTEKPPKRADVPALEKEMAAIEEKKKSLGEGFQREVAERKASRIGAVSRRAQSRPMLSTGVTL